MIFGVIFNLPLLVYFNFPPAPLRIAPWLDSSHYQATLYAFGPLIAGVSLIALGVRTLIRERGSTISVIFLGMMLSGATWLLSYGMAYLALHEPTALHWVRVSHLGVCFIPSFVFLFALAIIKQFRSFRFLVCLSFIFSILFSLVEFLTHRFIVGLYHYFWGYYAQYHPFIGSIFVAFFTAMLVMSLGVLGREYRRAPPGRQKARLAWFMTAFGISYFGALDFAATFGIALYPFGYLPVLGFVFIAGRTIEHYHLVDITPAFAVQKIMDNMAEALVVFDCEGLIQVTNQRASQLFREQEYRLRGRHVQSLNPPLITPDRIETLLHMKAIPDYQVSYLAKEGDPRILNVSATLMSEPVEGPQAVVCLIRDITERKQAENLEKEKIKLEAELAERKRSNEELEQFAYVASHDLREPLNKIVAFGDLLKDRNAASFDVKSKDYLERMQNAAIRMSQLIEDLLNLSRVTTKAESFKPVALAKTVKEVLEDLELPIRETKARIDVGELPVVRGDPSQLRELFQNLVANALKFQKKEEPPRIVIQSQNRGQGVTEISIRDNGIGFEEKYLDRIFKPFERLHSKTEYEGSGIGLAICQRILARHGGTVTAKSEPGKGSTFIVTLPTVVPSEVF